MSQSKQARAEAVVAPPEFTEDRLALDFARQHSHELRYVPKWNRWLEWTGTRWRFDDTLNAYTRARKICRAAAARCNKPSISSAIAKAKTIAAVETMRDRMTCSRRPWRNGIALLWRSTRQA
ncbi:MAG: hypothetical protein ACR2KT_15670 [Methylocella sp.]|nr:MAG: hypothetical protein DLM68_14190 [Hyphomicrobiales bacterium]